MYACAAYADAPFLSNHVRDEADRDVSTVISVVLSVWVSSDLHQPLHMSVASYVPCTVGCVYPLL